MTWIAPQSPPDDAAHIADLRAELADLRNHFDDIAGFPVDTQANILTRLRELADLTGEPMLTHDQTEALVRERDRLARVLAVEGGDEAAAPEGWRTKSDRVVTLWHRGPWSVYRHRSGVWRAYRAGSSAWIGEYPSALEAMEAADAAGERP